ncbi:choline dehydrogenase [Pseudohyphozyma bogoriensis]|nr:choline dehydrogenase [Pseudohyphozyma bogoriensis]
MVSRRSSPIKTLGLALLSASLVAAGGDEEWEYRQLLKRSNTVTTPSSLSGKTFDYVIVGGGTAGLVIANRLTADSKITVAVIEAGTVPAAGSDAAFAMESPGQAYFDGEIPSGCVATMTSDYDWHYNTVAQTGLNNRTIYWPRGKTLGGSSAVNGLFMTRASQIEHDAWAALNPGSSSTWGWDGIYPYMKKSETWTDATAENVALAGMVTNASYHGTSGPIHYSYPGFFYEQTSNWIPTCEAVGVSQVDPAGGETWGSYVVTSAINPDGWVRSDAKTGYLDSAANRTNLVVLSGYQATKINFNGVNATGVTFAASATGTTYTVSASSEVILSAGVIGTPQLLLVSGVGPKAQLEALDIDVVVDLPGVGMQLVDHLSGQLAFNATTTVDYTGDMIENDPTFAAEQKALFLAGNATSLYNSPNDAIAYINADILMGSTAAAEYIAAVKANQSATVAAYSAYSTDSTVLAGYNATYTSELNDILPTNVGQAEIIFDNTGTYGGYGNGTKTVVIQAAIQHPLSRGSVTINSTSTFDAPLIDPGYLNHPADIIILREAFKWARTLSQTAPLSEILTTELSPGSAVSTDAEWEDWIRTAVSTEYHPSGSCSMLPLDNGGCVDTHNRVYGTNNLRVIDSSIVPFSFAAHMTAPLYGIAELSYAILANDIAAASSSASATSTGSSDNGVVTVTDSSSSAAATSTSTTSAGSRLTVGRMAAALFTAVLGYALC